MAVLKYYNTTTSAWEYIAASTTANFTSWKKTMAGGETSVSGTDDNAVTLSYTVGLEQVFINGVLQVRGTDYVATTGTSVTGLTALVASDIVTVVCYAPFNIANTIAPTVIDAKGDLIAGTAADTVGRLAVGVDTAFLRPDSTASTGLKWDNDTWTSYTPTFTNWALGNGTINARYKQIGKTVFFRIKFTLGSTTTKSGTPFLSLPITASSFYAEYPMVVNSHYIDAGTDNYYYVSAIDSTTLYAGYNIWTTAGNKRDVSPTAPFTWVTNDIMMFHGFYEAA